jgi:hypothetical protein
MLTAAVPATLDEVLLDWHQSEPKRIEEVRTILKAKGIPVQPPLQEIRFARGALVAVGKPFFDAFPTEWMAGSITVEKIGEAKAINCWGLGNLSVAQVVNILPEFKPLRAKVEELKHRPILVAESQTSRPHLLDGYHRAAGLIHSRESQPIPVFLGICAKLENWVYYW